MRPQQIENYQLARLIELAECSNHLLRIIAEEVAPGRPRLSHIKIKFRRRHRHMPTPGPVTLTSAGQQVTASVVGFDQFGQPFTGELPAVTFTDDSPDASLTVVTFDPTTGLVTAVSNGVANITATLTTNEGLILSDTEAVTVAIPVVPPPTPVLSSIKVAFE